MTAWVADASASSGAAAAIWTKTQASTTTTTTLILCGQGSKDGGVWSIVWCFFCLVLSPQGGGSASAGVTLERWQRL